MTERFKRVDEKLPGMDSIAFMREVVLGDDKLIEQADLMQTGYNNTNAEMIQREFNPNLMNLHTLNVDSDEYDLFNKYIYGLGTFLSTKKLMSSIGITFDSTSEVDFRSLFLLNRDVQSILPELVRRLLTSLNNALETGEYNSLYQFLYSTLRDDIVNFQTYKYETIGSSFESVDAYEDFIDSTVEKITESMYKTKYTMGILIHYNENDYLEAKTKIEELFSKYGIDISLLLKEIMPEQLISEPSQFQTLLQSYIQNNPEIMEKVSDEEARNEIQNGIANIMIELANNNAISKFNKTNGMLGNIFPTINIAELIVMSLLKLSYKLDKDEELNEEEEEVLRTLDGIVFDKLGGREATMGLRLMSPHINLLLSMGLYVSDIVTSQLSLRAVDGSFQTMCSSVMNILVPQINEYIQVQQKEIMGEEQ